MIKDNFFDRKSYLDIIEKRVTGLKDGYRQNIAIIGDERVGKTSLIFRFLHKFCDPQIIALYVEARPESLSSFARRFIGALLYNFLVNSNTPLQEDLDFLTRKSAKYIPRTVEKVGSILDALEKRRKSTVFTELLSLPEIFRQETGKYCVVILDEFNHLEAMGIKNLYAEWAKLLIAQKNTMYIIISSMKFKTKTILAKNLSLLFGNFEVINTEPFDVRTSEEYLKFALQDLDLPGGLRNFIIHFSGGYPFYLELISKTMLKAKMVNPVDMLEDLLFVPSGILNQKFSDYMRRFLESPGSHDQIDTLYLISNGHNKLKDIAHILHKPRKQLNVTINHLLELDTITRSGDFLKINDRVFSFWLKVVYRARSQSLTFDAENQRMIFRNNIEGMIQEFLFSAQKPVGERVMELLRLFSDETIQIERKRIRLNHFREIKHLELNNRIKDAVIGRSKDGLWIMGLKQAPLTEEDITDFARECRKYRHKLQRKIIIALQDVEVNARLRALEEKIWTWDLNNLNQILDLFSRPRVIV